MSPQEQYVRDKKRSQTDSARILAWLLVIFVLVALGGLAASIADIIRSAP